MVCDKMAETWAKLGLIQQCPKECDVVVIFTIQLRAQRLDYCKHQIPRTPESANSRKIKEMSHISRLGWFDSFSNSTRKYLLWQRIPSPQEDKTFDVKKTQKFINTLKPSVTYKWVLNQQWVHEKNNNTRYNALQLAGSFPVQGITIIYPT